MSESHSPVLVRMQNELKAQLVREAQSYGRSLTAEINLRLRESLKPNYGPTLTAIVEKEALAKGSEKSSDLHATDLAMLTVFRSLPVEKQLALLSLLR